MAQVPPSSIIPRIDPEASRFRAPAPRIEHGYRCIVGKEVIGGKNVAAQFAMQRIEPPTGTAHPAGQGGSLEFHTVAGEDLRLAVERRVIAVFGGQYLREQRRGCQAVGDRARRRRTLMDGITRSTAVLRPSHLQYPQLRRYPVEHFAHRVFDEVQRSAAARAGRFIDTKRFLLARQMRGQRISMREFINGRFDRVRHVCTREGSAEIGVQVLEGEGKLIGAEFFRSCTELSALEFADDQAQTLNFIVSLRQAARHIAHQLVQKSLIGGQILRSIRM